MRFSVGQLGEVADVLRMAARQEIMPRFRNLAAGGVRTKSGPLDFVTEADEAAERLIAAELARRFPGCLVVGEEASEVLSAQLTPFHLVKQQEQPQEPITCIFVQQA